MHYNYSDKNNYYNSNDLKHFYESFHDLKITDINNDSIEIIESFSKELNAFYENKFNGFSKLAKYFKIVNKIKTTRVGNSTEKLLIFMFSVDPDFKAISIFNEQKDSDSIKTALKSEFGLYDPNLIKIENWYIKNLQNKKTEENDNNSKKI